MAVVVVGLVLATVWTQWSSRRAQQRANAYEECGHSGLAALDRGAISEAYMLLEKAERMRTADSGLVTSQAYTQAASELRLVVNLMAEPLGEQLSEAAKSQGTQRVTGRAVILDLELEWDAGGSIRPGAIGFVGDEPVSVDLGSLRVLSGGQTVGRMRALFGARMNRLERDGVKWHLTLDPSSGAWITHPAVLAFLGIDDEETRSLANAQRERIGLPPWGSTR